MQSGLHFNQEGIYTLHFSADIPQQPADDPFVRVAHAYGARLANIADMLFKMDWFTLTTKSEELKAIISAVKDVISVLEEEHLDDSRINKEAILDELYNSLEYIHSAGEHSQETKSSEREAKHPQIIKTCRTLKTMSKNLMI
ncbi:MAG: hypothetical protein ABI324_02690 [Ktedonobacteraceae bacterium]